MHAGENAQQVIGSEALEPSSIANKPWDASWLLASRLATDQLADIRFFHALLVDLVGGVFYSSN